MLLKVQVVRLHFKKTQPYPVYKRHTWDSKIQVGLKLEDGNIYYANNHKKALLAITNIR